MSALRELIAFFGVEVDDKKLDHAGEKMEGLAKLAEQVGATIGLAFGLHEISEFIQGQIELAAHIGNTAEILGVATDELQEFRYAALNADVEVDAADKSLRFLNKNLGEAVSGNAEAAKTFRDLGVDIASVKDGSRNATSLLPDIADKFLKIESQAERTALAMKIFGKQGASLLPLLQKGGKELEKYRDEFEELGGGISEAQIKIAEEGEHSIKKMRTAYNGLKATVASALIPAFTWLVDKLGHAVIWFRALATHSYIVQTAIAVLTAGVTALAIVWGILNFEVLLVVLAIALLVLIVDDVYTAFMGGKSVVGDFIDSLLGVGATTEIVTALKQVAHELWGKLGELWTASKDLAEVFSGVTGESVSMKDGLKLVLAVISNIGSEVKIAVDLIVLLEKAIVSVAGKYADFKKDHPLLAKTIESAPNPFSGLSAENRDNLGPGKTLGGGGTFTGVPAEHAPTFRRAAGGDGGDVIQHNTIQVDVKGGPANADTGNAVAQGVQRGVDGSDMQSAFAAVPGNGGS